MDADRDSTDPPGPRRLFLIGYRGTGKSTVAGLAARRLGWESVDADDEVRLAAGKSIAAIFAEDGETAFRDLEERVVAALCDRERTVVALGGGAVLREATRRRLRAAGPAAWLTASAETLASRVAGDAASAAGRPRLTELDPADEVRAVLARREPIYRACATFAVDTEGVDPDTVAAAIVARLAAL